MSRSVFICVDFLSQIQIRMVAYLKPDLFVSRLLSQPSGGVFGLNYDDLKQRHREREMKRRIVIASVAFSIVSHIGTNSSSNRISLTSYNLPRTAFPFAGILINL